MGFLGNLFNPKNLNPMTGLNKFGGYGLPGISDFGHAKKPQAASGPDPNDWNRWGLPWWLVSQQGTHELYPGVSTMLDMLNNPGQTDSLMVNRDLTANARATQNAQNASTAQFARSGFGGSGLGAALQAAIAGQGADRAAGIYAQEARRREDLKRQDIGLLDQYFANPRMQEYGAINNVSIGKAQQDAQKKSAEVAGGAALIGALIAAFACKTAEELYGVDAEETHLARFYMGTMADEETRRMYGTGAPLAERVKADPALRAKVKPIFDTFVDEARTALGA